MGGGATRDLGAGSAVWDVLRDRLGDEQLLHLVQMVNVIEAERAAALVDSQREAREEWRDQLRREREAAGRNVVPFSKE